MPEDFPPVVLFVSAIRFEESFEVLALLSHVGSESRDPSSQQALGERSESILDDCGEGRAIIVGGDGERTAGEEQPVEVENPVAEPVGRIDLGHLEAEFFPAAAEVLDGDQDRSDLVRGPVLPLGRNVIGVPVGVVVSQ